MMPLKSVSFSALDPRLLGRPVHLLPRLALQLQPDFLDLRKAAGRRHWAAVELVNAVFRPIGDEDSSATSFACVHGTVAFGIERALLLSVLHQRYRRRGAPPETLPDPSTLRISATEERLERALGQQLAAVLARRVAVNLGESQPDALPQVCCAASAPAGWCVEFVLREKASGQSGRCKLELDDSMLAACLRGLQSPRPSRITSPPQPLGLTLQMQLDALLARRSLTLEQLFSLQVGDLIPVRFGRAEVRLADAPLLSAAVAQDDGTLCLTSFELLD